MQFPKAIVFDLDKTLSESKLPVTEEMAARLARLVRLVPVAITSGQKLSQLISQAATFIPEPLRKNLYLLPTSGAALYYFDEGDWKPVYKEALSIEEAQRIMKVMEEVMRETGIPEKDAPHWGPLLEHRDSAVALSALGQAAPLQEKMAWDPHNEKRLRFREALMPRLPEYEVRVAGATSVDINKKGIDKAYGVRRLSDYLHIPIPEMLYVGDDLGHGGNDEVVIATGIPTHAVENPVDTGVFIDSLLAEFGQP